MITTKNIVERGLLWSQQTSKALTLHWHIFTVKKTNTNLIMFTLNTICKNVICILCCDIYTYHFINPVTIIIYTFCLIYILLGPSLCGINTVYFHYFTSILPIQVNTSRYFLYHEMHINHGHHHQCVSPITYHTVLINTPWYISVTKEWPKHTHTRTWSHTITWT